MGEMRLICPGCEAEYRLPPKAIPASGREVECTACGRVWFALPDGSRAAGPGAAKATDAQTADKPALDPAPGTPRADMPPPAGAEPQLSRKLPGSVLSILREEVEHERRARMAEDADFGKDSPEPAETLKTAPLSPGAPTVDWPATTVVTPSPGPDVKGTDRPVPADAAPARTLIGSEARARPAATEPATRDAPADPPGAATERSGALAAAPARPLVEAPPEHDDGEEGSAYRLGLGVAAMITGIGLTLYLLAPGLADAGPLGDALAGMRQLVDAGRMWLQTQVGAVLG